MRWSVLLALLLFIGSCSSGTKEEVSENGSDTLVVHDTIIQTTQIDTAKLREETDLSVFFEKYGVTGAFLLFDPQANKYYRYNAPRTKEPFIPASTYKILNSLIALETGVIADTNTVIKWDGVEREVAEWNQDHDMKSAFKVSAVWFYQELARRIGQKRMQHYVNLAEYGNQNISGGIDQFWLTGKLRISMEEQIIFLRKLYKNELPFSNSTQQKVKSIMSYLETPEYTIRAKTGWAQKVGWFVGWVEKPDNTGYYFAVNIEMKDGEDAEARKAIAIDILKSMQII